MPRKGNSTPATISAGMTCRNWRVKVRFILEIDLGREQPGTPALARAASLMKSLAQDIERNDRGIMFETEGTTRYSNNQGDWKLVAEKRDLKPRRMRICPNESVLFLAQRPEGH